MVCISICHDDDDDGSLGQVWTKTDPPADDAREHSLRFHLVEEYHFCKPSSPSLSRKLGTRLSTMLNADAKLFVRHTIVDVLDIEARRRA